MGQLAAEFVGTLILILFGVGVVAQVVTAGDEDYGNHNSIAWAWGMGVTFGIFAAGRISGAHLNPAVTVALAVFRGFPWKQVIPFILAQVGGAFVAALLVRWNYGSVLAAIDPGHTIATQGVFSTLPGNGALDVSLWGGLRDQIMGTAILLFLIFAITDRRNIRMPEIFAALSIGAVVVGLGMAWGPSPGTRSTRPVTSVHGSRPISPVSIRPFWTSTVPSTGGCRSSGRSSVVCGRCAIPVPGRTIPTRR